MTGRGQRAHHDEQELNYNTSHMEQGCVLGMRITRVFFCCKTRSRLHLSPRLQLFYNNVKNQMFFFILFTLSMHSLDYFLGVSILFFVYFHLRPCLASINSDMNMNSIRSTCYWLYYYKNSRGVKKTVR